MGAAPKFPDPNPEDKARVRRLTLNSRQPPVFETISEDNAEALLGVAQHVVKGAQDLLEFVDTNRPAARQAGIETLAIELAAILEGERLDRVVDALEHAAERSKPAQLSLDGLQLLRRVERLLAEAASNIRRFSSYQAGIQESLEAGARRDADRRKALLEIEERRLDLLRLENRAREEAATRELSERRAALASLTPPPLSGFEIPFLSEPPRWDDAPRASRPLGAVPASPAPTADDGRDDGLSWAIVVFGALTFGAALVFALTAPAAREPEPRSRYG